MRRGDALVTPVALRRVGSDGFEQRAGADVARRVAELRQRTSLELTDALPGETEVLGDLLETALLAVEAEPETQDRALPLVEDRQDPLHLTGQHRGGRGLERRGCPPG